MYILSRFRVTKYDAIFYDSCVWFAKVGILVSGSLLITKYQVSM